MIDLNKIKTIPIAQRKNKLKLDLIIKPEDSVVSFNDESVVLLKKKIVEAYKGEKQIILMMGSHVIKTGMSLLIIDLMKKKIINHIAMNGSGPIHDFEIALIGETSEYVEETIEDGSFGMAEETGKYINEAIKEGAKSNFGLGESIAKKIINMNLKYKEFSILANAYKLNIPVTVHSAIGTEIIHQHPSCDGAAIGKTSYNDFKKIIESITKLEEGVIINIGSAVILPEVFLKAFTVARNLGFNIKKFTAANIDMTKHYRPTVNVVERPTSLGGLGLTILGRHEETIPSLHRLITDELK